MYSIMFISGVQPSDQTNTLQDDHHNKLSNYSSPSKLLWYYCLYYSITIGYILHPHDLSCTENLQLLISFTYYALSPFLLPISNTSSVLCVYKSGFYLFICFVF